MNNKTEHNFLPFAFDDLEEADYLCYYYNDVIFTETFGIFEKGEKADTLYVDLDKGTLQTQLECGTIHKIQHFYPEPVL